jgi:hypothetical protein
MTALEIILSIAVLLLSLAVWFFWKRMLYWYRMAEMWKANYDGSAAYRPSLISSIAPVLFAYIAGLFIGKKFLSSDE